MKIYELDIRYAEHLVSRLSFYSSSALGSNESQREQTVQVPKYEVNAILTALRLGIAEMQKLHSGE